MWDNMDSWTIPSGNLTWGGWAAVGFGIVVAAVLTWWYRKRKEDWGISTDSEWFVVSSELGFCSLSFNYGEFREQREDGTCQRYLNALRAAYEDVWPKFQQIYKMDNALYLQLMPVYRKPISYGARLKPIQAFPDAHKVMIQFQSPGPNGTEFDLSAWVAELHSMYKFYAFGPEHVYDNNYPSPEQCLAAQDVVKPYWWPEV